MGIHQLRRKSSSGVGWAATSMVALEAFSHVGGATNVVGAITAAKDVDEMGHRIVPFDSPAFTRSLRAPFDSVAGRWSSVPFDLLPDD